MGHGRTLVTGFEKIFGMKDVLPLFPSREPDRLRLPVDPAAPFVLALASVSPSPSLDPPFFWKREPLRNMLLVKELLGVEFVDAPPEDLRLWSGPWSSS